MGRDKSEFCCYCGSTMPKIFREQYQKMWGDRHDLQKRYIRLQEELIMVRAAFAKRYEAERPRGSMG